MRPLIRSSRNRDRSNHRTQRLSKLPSRIGAAAVEAAIAVPLVVTIVFGAIELSNAIFLRQSLNIAAYEAAKVVTRPGTNEPLARTRCAEIMNIRQVSNFTMSVSPTVTPTTPRGTAVTVTIMAPASNLSYGPVRFMTGKDLTVSVVMVRL